MIRRIIGSRGSQLALWQARWVAARVAGAEIAVLKTSGDSFPAAPPAGVSFKGLFTREIEEALLEGRVDIAVHSLKDLPAQMDPRLVLAAIPKRGDPRDALVGGTLAALGPGAVVGTSSLRRACQLRRLRPDLVVESLRGNVDTRLRKLDEGRCQAIVLAAEGLRRLSLDGRIAELLHPEQMCPAPGQGALAIQIRAGDKETQSLLDPLEDAPARAATAAERALLQELGGGCQVPIGALARISGERLRLLAVVASPDGAELLRVSIEGSAAEPAEIGRRAAGELLARGAGRILQQVYAP